MVLRRPRLVLGAVVAGLVAVTSMSCDPADGERRRDAAFEAKLRRVKRAESAVVVKAYDEGRLGPRQEVMAEVVALAREVVPAGVPAPALFDVDGNLLHYDRLDAGGRLVFDEWITTSPRISSVLRDELFDARQRAEDPEPQRR